MHRKSIVALALGILVSVAGFYLAFRHVPLDSLVAYARYVDYRWTLPALLVLAVTYFVRSLRWQFLLRPLGRVALATAYHSIIVSIMINCILPGRMGEMARPLIIRRKAGLSFASSLATLAAERLLDMATLLTLLVLALPIISTSPGRIVSFGGYELSSALLNRLVLTSGFGLVLLLGALFSIAHGGIRQWYFKVIACCAAGVRRLLPRRRGPSIEAAEKHLRTFLERCAEGLQALSNPGHLLLVVLMSTAVWLLNGLSFYLVALGCPQIHLGYADIIVTMVVICVFIALPSVPGFWGLWEAAGVFALAYFGINAEPAAGFTLFNHALQILPVIAAGWLSCIFLGIRWSDMLPGRIAEKSSDTRASKS